MGSTICETFRHEIHVLLFSYHMGLARQYKATICCRQTTWFKRVYDPFLPLVISFVPASRDSMIHSNLFQLASSLAKFSKYPQIHPKAQYLLQFFFLTKFIILARFRRTTLFGSLQRKTFSRLFSHISAFPFVRLVVHNFGVSVSRKKPNKLKTCARSIMFILKEQNYIILLADSCHCVATRYSGRFFLKIRKK